MLYVFSSWKQIEEKEVHIFSCSQVCEKEKGKKILHHHGSLLPNPYVLNEFGLLEVKAWQKLHCTISRKNILKGKIVWT